MSQAHARSPAQELRQRQSSEALLIREVVGRRLGLPVDQVTNWTKLGEFAADIFNDLTRLIGKSLPEGTSIGAETDVVALISIFRDAT